MESGERVKAETVVRRQPAPLPEQSFVPCNSPGTVSQRCFPDSCVVFRAFVVESHEVMDSAPLNEDEPLPVREKVSALCVFVHSAVLPPPRLLLEGPAIYPDLVWSGNISTSPLCWTETDIPPLTAFSCYKSVV